MKGSRIWHEGFVLVIRICAELPSRSLAPAEKSLKGLFACVR